MKVDHYEISLELKDKAEARRILKLTKEIDKRFSLHTIHHAGFVEVEGG